ncbi:MAG TPA: (5-formylfuran-3-yl)methyl phosphate synthase [Gammaproteobacteria bacterium]
MPVTGMLASVQDVAEARVVLAAGVDLIDLKNPSTGALGALDEDVLRDIVRFVDGRRPVSATIGDLPCETGILGEAIGRTAACGVDLIKVGIFASRVDDGTRCLLKRHCAAGDRIILVFFAEYWRDGADFRRLAQAGVEGVMLDTADKGAGPLTKRMDIPALRSFVTGARDVGLLAGLAGSLSTADVHRLLPLQPDYLGFRGALCPAGRRGGDIDARAVGAIRELLAGDALSPDGAIAPAAA